jgi:nitroreductase
MEDAVTRVVTYHDNSKHHFERYARGPGFLDWATQPDPFRRYHGAVLRTLDRPPPTGGPHYDSVFALRGLPAAPLTGAALSQLLFDSLALSAWKSGGGSRWALRVNPSSGNLHPTEGHVLCGALPGFWEAPFVAHYTPQAHALEVRAEVPEGVWRNLCAGFPSAPLLLALTSIHWREAWKYGERAYRYCQLDTGHALAAVSVAAAGLGWQAHLWDGMGSENLVRLLGLRDPQGAEAEEPEGILVITPRGEPVATAPCPSEACDAFGTLRWLGVPNRLSPARRAWPAIEHVAAAVRKPHGSEWREAAPGAPAAAEAEPRPSLLRRIIHQRRSALAMDGVTMMERSAFYGMLQRTLAVADRPPFALLPWAPRVHLALFVHRVKGVPAGLYLLVRNDTHRAGLQAAMKEEFLWQKPEGCPQGLELYLLAEGDLRRSALELSCLQEIAGGGCFSLGMIAAFEEPITAVGAWCYPRLYWECGMIGQMLYLEAEAAGLRGTGIGCFFDDPVHAMLGLEGRRFQDLYHFTVGGAVEDPRLTTLPAYPDSTP